MCVVVLSLERVIVRACHHREGKGKGVSSFLRCHQGESEHTLSFHHWRQGECEGVVVQLDTENTLSFLRRCQGE